MTSGSGPIIKPPRLRPGDTVAVVAPASPWEYRSERIRAIEGLEDWGLKVKPGRHLDDRHAYVAGRDEDRAADLNEAYADPEVRAIVCFQGGYGSSRLLPLLDRDLIAANPKALCGYSDITSLHLAVEAWSDTITFYSNGANGVGARETSDFSKETMHRALFGDEVYGEIPRNPEDPWVRTITGGTAQGRLTGGCLSLVQATLGTPIEIQTEGKILYLEDLDMHSYTFDTILIHLRNAGKLDGAVGIVVGEMKDVGWRDDHSAFMQELSVEDVLEEIVGPLGIPCVYGLPIGHGKHHVTVPHGAHATLDADAGSLIVDEAVTAEPAT